MKKYTIIHRALHFFIGISMLILFGTGFLRMEWMNKRNLAQLIETQALKNHIIFPEASLKMIGSQLLEPMWKWHIYFAYAILVFFTLRLIYMKIKGIRFPNPFAKQTTFKEKLQGITYILFYLLIFVDIITGFYILWGEGTYKSVLEPIHKYSLYWFPIFFILHLIGIVTEEITKKTGITSKMINGKE